MPTKFSAESGKGKSLNENPSAMFVVQQGTAIYYYNSTGQKRKHKKIILKRLLFIKLISNQMINIGKSKYNTIHSKIFLFLILKSYNIYI